MLEPCMRMLRRERVFQMLQKMENFPVSVVIAPWGYGKTVAVTDYFQRSGKRCVWITMSTPVKITDVDFFWLLFTRALKREFPALGGWMETLGFPRDMMQMYHFLDEMQREKMEQDIYIVIDDFQYINTAEIDLFISQIVRANTPKLHWIVLSREFPALPVHEWEMKGICHVITAGELAFTVEEAEAYLEQIGCRADQKVQKTMIHLSNGWIAFIYLMAKDYERFHTIDQHATIYSMMRSCIYDTYSEEEKEYLMKLSLLDTFSDEQIAEIFERPEEIFHMLKTHIDNVLIMKRPDGDYYLHDLFRRFLQNEQQISRLDICGFAERVAEWATRYKRHLCAFKFWLLAGKYDRILEELEETPVMEMFQMDKKVLREIFTETQEDIYRYPMAYLKYIFTVCVEESAEAGKELLEQFRERCRELNHPNYSREHLLAESYILETVLLFNDLDGVIEYIDKAEKMLDGKKSSIRIRHSNLTYGSPHMTYAYYNKPGILKHITDNFVYRFDAHIQVADGNGFGADCVAQAEYGLETGNLEQVEYQAKKALFKAAQYEQTCMVICAYMTLGRLYIAQKQTDKARQVIQSLKAMYDQVQVSSMLYTLDGAIGYLNGIIGNYGGIPKWLCTGEFEHSNSAWQRLAFSYVVFGKAILLKKDYMYLKFQTELFERKFATFHYQLGYIHNYIFMAICDFNLYGIGYAVESLQKALDIALKDAVLMPFVEYYPFISSILNSDKLRIPGKYKRRIVLLATDPANDTEAGKPGGILTDRETEIMQCMEEGMNNAEIAEALFISLNTVKRHIQNIYRKLNVQNRAMALVHFRRLRNK